MVFPIVPTTPFITQFKSMVSTKRTAYEVSFAVLSGQLDRQILFSTYPRCRKASCQGQTVAGKMALSCRTKEPSEMAKKWLRDGRIEPSFFGKLWRCNRLLLKHLHPPRFELRTF
jgi:hypothetical protein